MGSSNFQPGIIMCCSPEYLLVTTALEQTWGTDETVLFLGEWCKRYSRKEQWQKRNHHTQLFHWADRSKLAKDHDYLKDCYERLLVWLTHELNRLHNVDHSLRYWRIVIGPWLITYIPVIWGRWEEIRRVTEKRKRIATVIPTNDSQLPVPSGYGEAQKLMFSDEWNYLLCVDILKIMSPSQVTCIKRSLELNFDFIGKGPRKKSLKSRIAKMIDQLVGSLKVGNYNVVIYDGYFPLPRMVTLFLKIGQLPRFFRELDSSVTIHEPNYFMRDEIGSSGAFSTAFERFLVRRISMDLPLAHLEGYQNLTKEVDSLPIAKIVVTASPFENELFKVWSANQVNLGAKFVVSNHGGAIISRFAMFNHEDDIADVRTVWHKPFRDNHIQISPNKLKSNLRTCKRNITLIGLDMPRYQYRAHCGPTGPLMLNEIKQKTEFINHLDTNVKSKFFIRPQSAGGWDTRDRFIDLFGEEIISKQASLMKDYAYSKLIICSYPQTTFSEAMSSGIPVVLLYLESCWEFVSLFDELLRVLKSAKIVFSESKAAAAHINSIQEHPEIWWNSEEVIEARKLFSEFCCKISENPTDEWSKLLNDLSSKEL